MTVFLNKLRQNRLETDFNGDNRFPEHNPKEPVTIIIGIICKDGIILASDSQTTKDGMKRTDAQKICSVSFDNGRIMVANAGNAGNAARAIEVLEGLAESTKITDYRTPAELARMAMNKVRQELREQRFNCSAEELQEFIQKNEQQAELMLAYYFRGEPYIFTIDLAIGRADKEHSYFTATGCGASLGAYLLSELTQKNMGSGPASILAVHIIETVCKHDTYCSSPAKLGVIKDDSGQHEDFAATAIYSSSAIARLSQIAKSVMGKIGQIRRGRIQKAIRKEAQKNLVQMLLAGRLDELRFFRQERKKQQIKKV